MVVRNEGQGRGPVAVNPNAVEMARDMWKKGRQRDHTRRPSWDSDVEKEAILDDEGRLVHFPNYQPAGRLVIVEVSTLVILVMLLLANPEGVTAVATKGTSGGIGLLRSCSGTCTSWLGAGSGGGGAGGGSGSAVTARDLQSRQQNGGGGSSSSSSSSTSDPASFHLTAGLAGIVTFYTVLFAWLFHLTRWWYYRPPPLHPPEEPVDKEGYRWWRVPGRWDGTKRFGYRVSRSFTLVNIPLLVYIAFSSVMLATQTAVGTGFYLLLWACVNSVMVALWEFLDPRGKIGSKLLMWRAVRFRPGGKYRVELERKTDRDLDREERGKIPMSQRTLRGGGGQPGLRRRPESPRLPPKASLRGEK